ncbi:MAG TPA: hypothetical protein VEN30_15775 [Paraburkholderia sp.]|nr:hypothetical protein [Paraburkholderia sp.]
MSTFRVNGCGIVNVFELAYVQIGLAASHCRRATTIRHTYACAAMAVLSAFQFA